MAGEGWGGVTVKVSSAELKRQADEVSRRIESLTVRFAELERAVRSTRGYWLGEAGEMHRAAFEDQRGELQEMLQRLRRHPVELLQISGNYERTEQRVTETISTLDETVIS